MRRNDAAVIGKDNMKSILNGYRMTEARYPGFTEKSEAVAIVAYCYDTGWPDLVREALDIFKMDILDIAPSVLSADLKKKKTVGK